MASTEVDKTVQEKTVSIHPDELVNSVVDEDATLAVRRLFTIEGRDPYDEVEWEIRDAHIPGKNGPAFEQKSVEFPKFWSQTATNIVAQKYFRGRMSSPERESSVKHMIGRIVGTVGTWGRDGGYFASEDEAATFEAELKAILVNQLAAFNSPVWFNVGFEEKPQCSACFILSIEDNMDSILDWIRREGVIFRGGSGSGINLSKLRSSKEQLSKGGYASGPVSFMRGADASAGTIKSGGKTRRAAKMVVLDIDHPDITEFIWCKAHEEEKARVLEAAGYDMSLDSPDWSSIQYQNANNSVRVSDAFMEAVEADTDWNLTARSDGTVVETIKARKLLHDLSEAAWRCADPGVQYDTTINSWHTLPNTGRINASNPCSEYMSIDDSACNLASLNLMKFRREDGELDVEAFEHACDVIFLAQEIMVGNSSYPTPEIEKNAKAYRQLGLGYANLGALLMARGLAYDSDEGRAYAAAITALMTGRAYRKSSEIAGRMGPFAGYRPNAGAMIGVIAKHRAAVGNIANAETVPADLLGAARKSWDEALDLGEVNGYRNAQATVLAPTGTISFMMDCDTTGVEPDFSLVKSKKLVGGGEITIVNKTVAGGLEKLGYAPNEVDEIVAFVDDHNTVVGAPYVKNEHYPVFDCAVGERAIHYRGHVKMMGAIQPFISGAISKTVNLPESATIEDIAQLYTDAWRLGVKAVAIYRDNCKVAQPLSGKGDKSAQTTLGSAGGAMAAPKRRRLPDDRNEIGRKFRVGEYEGYIHVGVFDDGSPGDIFVDIAKDGTTLQGLMNSLMIAVSMGLQYGVPPEVYVSKLSHLRFEPSGPTNDADIRAAKSIPDYIFRWFGKKFLDVDQQEEAGILSMEVRAQMAERYASGESKPVVETAPGQTALFNPHEDAIECNRCGGRMVRAGTCYTCRDCGTSTGCG
ncbi:MAG: ribonucleoside-diphosphate reductase alpha chain [Gaiellaceae bacterium]|jgi:ribonucleoside-diphosphate reductase alpha chain|nr:ribonucleoside-diphosphate reductase alpha chain [Gaiellaceae bacterium]